MTRHFFTYLFVLLLIASCNEEKTIHYTINGHANNMASDIMVFGLDSRFQKTDSIKADKEGNFSYTIESDTVVPIIMTMPDGKQITLYAEPGITANLSYDCLSKRHSITSGGPVQTLHDSISQVIEACRNEKERHKAIEEFIERHPISEVNIELLRRYMINVPDPDYAQIKNYISRLGGIIQDNEYLVITKKNIDNKSSTPLHRQFPSFTYFTADSCKKITPDSFNKKHLLVTFWASWDKESRKKMKSLKEIDNAVESKNFDILNIAVEHDTIEWRRIVESDSIIGYNVCDKDAWDSEIVNKFNIKSLPYSVLVNPYQRIINVDMDIENDVAAIDSIVTKHDKSVKEREKRRKGKEKKRR